MFLIIIIITITRGGLDALYDSARLDIPYSLCICVSICVLVTDVSPAKTDEPIELQLGAGPENHILNGAHIN